jgi:predicted nucleic acid-binding protein
VLSVLESLGSLSLPPAVHAEILARQPDWQSVKPRWLEITELDARPAEIAGGWLQAGLLDRGEAHALALAAQVKADWVLTDDAAARAIASQQGFEVHGSLGVILWAAATGHLGRDEADASLDALARSSLWISARVMSEAKVALQQIFATPL